MATSDMSTQDWEPRNPADLSPHLPPEDGGDVMISLKLEGIYRAIRRNLLRLVLVILACMVAGVVVTLLISPKYTASSRVVVEDTSPQIIQGSDLQSDANSRDSDRFLQTQIDVMTSRTLSSRVVEQAHLYDDVHFYEALGARMPASVDEPDTRKLLAIRKRAATDLLLNALSTNLPRDSRVIAISFTTLSPQYSARLANLYAQNYIQNNLNQKFDSSSYARQFLQDQLEQTRARLEASEHDLNRFARAAGVIRVTGQDDGKSTEGTLSITNDALTQLNAAASAATADRMEAEDNWKTISNQPTLSIPQVMANGSVSSLLTERAQLEGKLSDERSHHLENYPTVMALKAQITSLNTRIEAIGEAVKRSVYLQYQAALQKEQSLQEQVSGLRSNALDEQDRGVQYNLLKRIADTNRTSYDALLDRYNQINASAGAASNNVSLVDEAEVPSRPSSPNLFLNLILSFFMGCLLGAALVYLRELFDDRIHEPADVERKLGLPLLGLIPVASDNDVNADLLQPKSMLNEAYNSLVTNLRYATPDGLPHVVAVTSAGEGEGKSTTSWALAVGLARLGRNVLLIDADLRGPSLQGRISDTRQPGLTEVLIGQSSMDDVLVASGEANLTCMTALPMPPDPTVLLGGGNLPRLFNEARTRFDVVVVDCPPLLGLSDTPSIARHTDGLLFMVDSSGFHRGAVKSALRRLALIHAKVFGVVLTKFDPKGSGGDYSYYAYNYYSYGREGDD